LRTRVRERGLCVNGSASVTPEGSVTGRGEGVRDPLFLGAERVAATPGVAPCDAWCLTGTPPRKFWGETAFKSGYERVNALWLYVFSGFWGVKPHLRREERTVKGQMEVSASLIGHEEWPLAALWTSLPSFSWREPSRERDEAPTSPRASQGPVEASLARLC